MNRTANVMRMHAKDIFSWFYLPWIIIGGNFLINLIISLLVQAENNNTNGGMASLFVYFLIIGMITLHQTFPFSLSLSIRRTDYFWGTAVVAGVVGLVCSLIVVVMSAIEGQFGGWMGSFYFFRIYFISDHGWLNELWFYLSLILHLFFTGFLLACLHRRLGAAKLTIILGVLFIAFTAFSLLASYYGWWRTLLDAVIRMGPIQLVSLLSVLTLAYIGISLTVLRRTTV